jgi:hypothetical protein
LEAEAGVKPRSPKGRAAARGLDARLRLQHPFHASGRHFTEKSSGRSKKPLDSNHGIYRDLTNAPVFARFDAQRDDLNFAQADFAQAARLYPTRFRPGA